ncbi:MAG: hypothetical protein KF878_20265 [Planctomycetes bacterium]|nr:hypothetical protein [Planctomycetota bacterium]
MGRRAAGRAAPARPPGARPPGRPRPPRGAGGPAAARRPARGGRRRGRPARPARRRRADLQGPAQRARGPRRRRARPRSGLGPRGRPHRGAGLVAEGEARRRAPRRRARRSRPSACRRTRGRCGAPGLAPAVARVERRVVLLPGAGVGQPAAAGAPGARSSLTASPSGRPTEAVALVGGPRDAPRARAVLERCARARPVDLTGRHDLVATAAVLSASAAVVGGDTGPLHLARVLGRPVVALFHAADPARTGPAGLPGAAPARVLAGVADCAPCCAARCQRPDRRRVCLRAITADDVAARVLEVVAG